MPEDSLMPASLAYRKNQQAIWHGHAPEKYLRILPHVRGKRVLEIGAAEGVLALLMAERGHYVFAVERREERHQEAKQLQARWRAMGRKVNSCEMLRADIVKHPELLLAIDCLVCVRVVYHLKDDAPKIMAFAAEADVPHIVLCGNKNRAASFEAGRPEGSLGQFNYYSTIKGMSELLTGAGYNIATVVREGDPIVVGTHSSHQAS